VDPESWVTSTTIGIERLENNTGVTVLSADLK
jgi:hypothetical protein